MEPETHWHATIDMDTRETITGMKEAIFHKTTITAIKQVCALLGTPTLINEHLLCEYLLGFPARKF